MLAGVWLTKNIIDWDNGLSSNRRQDIIWTNDGVVYWRLYVSFGVNGLSVYIIS